MLVGYDTGCYTAEDNEAMMHESYLKVGPVLTKRYLKYTLLGLQH
jgi:hypothetical protein